MMILIDVEPRLTAGGGRGGTAGSDGGTCAAAARVVPA